MSFVWRFFAGFSTATVASTQTAPVKLGGAAVAVGAAMPTEKYMAGVPVLNYDQAYQGEPADPAVHESWIVVLEPGVRGDAIKRMCSLTMVDCRVMMDNPGFPFIALRATEVELASFVEPLREVSRFIEVDFTMRLPPPESTLHVEKNVQAAEVTRDTLWNLRRIGANTNTLTGAGVHVYVTDTGIRTDHVEFGGRAIAWLDMFKDTATRLCSDPRDVDCAGDVDGHGTHCAGIIAGETFGVAPRAMVYAAKVLDDEGSGPLSNRIYSLTTIASQGKRPAVVSMSLAKQFRSDAEQMAVDNAVYRGVTVVTSAGNKYRSACTQTPARVPSAITVGATGPTDARRPSSNFGPCVDIWAPGTDILSCDADRRNGRVVPNNASVKKNGTSMACPHVTGAAALLLEEEGTMLPQEIRDRLRARASENYITDLSPLDDNLLLYVGNVSETRQQPKDTSSWPSDEFFQACGKNGQWGPISSYPVCMCNKRADRNPVNGTRCYDGLKLGCPLGVAMTELDNSPGYENNPLSHWYYEWNCTTCFCLEEAPEAPEAAGPQLPYVLIFSVTVAVVLAGVAFYAYYARAKPEKHSDPLTLEVVA